MEPIKISGTSFIKEKTGNIKDFYKITSCIGRGRPPNSFSSLIEFFFIRCIW